MGRTSRIAVIALLAATALGGCGVGSEGATVVPPELEGVVEAAEATTDFCTAAQTNVDAGIALTEFSLAAPPPRSTDEIAAVLEPVRESNEQMLAAAPEVAREDVALVAELSELRLAAYEASGGDPAAADADPAVVERLEAVTEPSARIRQYLRAVCRIDPN